MQSRNKDVLVALSIVLLNVIWLLLPFSTFWIGVILALPLVFFVPGYMLLEMLTHTRELDVFHRLPLSLGLSLTLDILGGFLLNVFPIGLRTQSWITLLGCLTLLFALAILYLRRRRVHTSGEENFVVQPKDKQTLLRRRFALVRNGLLFALAVTLVILSLLYATRGVAEHPRSGFTQLWMTPASHSVQSCTLNIGIRSFENSTVTYSAVMTNNGTQTMLKSALVLAPSQTWERSIVIKPTTTRNMFVQVKLYRNDKPALVYREVHTTLTVLNSKQKTFACRV